MQHTATFIETINFVHRVDEDNRKNMTKINEFLIDWKKSIMLYGNWDMIKLIQIILIF